MAAGITVRKDGKAEAAYALKPAWHKMGTVVDHAMTSEEAMTIAGLDWPVVSRPLFFDGAGLPCPDGEQPEARKTPGFIANVRKDNGLVLGVVSDTYKVIQNSEAFKFTDSLVMDKVIRYESCGSLWGGRAVWILARSPKVDKIGTDEQHRYILFVNYHDGTGACTVMPTSVRVECQNMLNMALAVAKENEKLRIVHTGNLAAKVEAARVILGLVDEQFDGYTEIARALVKKQIRAEALNEYVEECLPVASDAGNKTKERVERDRAAVVNLFDHETNTREGVAGTAWAAFNAVTLWSDHFTAVRSTGSVDGDRERRFAALTLSDGAKAKFKADAFKIAAREFAGVEI